MHRIILKMWLCLYIVLASCTLMASHVRTIYVPERDAIMLAQDVPNVDIWAKPADEDPLKGKMDLEEGWM